MGTLLPNLIFVRFVRRPVITELIEQPFAAFELELRDKFFGREALEIAQDGGEIRRGENRVEMIVENHPEMASPLCSRQYSSDRTTMSQHAVDVKTGSHSTIVAVTKQPRADSRAE